MKKVVATKYLSDTHTFTVEVTSDGSVELFNSNGLMAQSALKNLHKFLGEVLLDLGIEVENIKKPEVEVEKAPPNPRFAASEPGLDLDLHG